MFHEIFRKRFESLYSSMYIGISRTVDKQQTETRDIARSSIVPPIASSLTHSYIHIGVFVITRLIHS